MSESEVELVSVVIPSRNRRRRLECAIESVRQQTWPNIEIIVVDDASSDDTPKFLRKLQESDPTIMVVRNEVPLGGAGARNAGIALARGVYIAFLDDDDTWMREKLRSQIALMKARPSASSVSCSFFIRYSAGNQAIKHVSSPIDIQQILHTNRLGGASMCLTTRKLLVDIGGFDPTLRSGQDWDLWIRLNHCGPVLVCQDPLVCYSPHEGTRITTNPHAIYAGRRRIFLKYRNRMTSETHKHHLCELLYCRLLLLERHRMHRAICLQKAVIFVGLRRSVRYLYRYLKYRLSKCELTFKRIS